MIESDQTGISSNLARYLSSPEECLDLDRPSYKILSDYDVSTMSELISTLILMVIFIVMMAYQLILVKHTYVCMKKSKLSTMYLFVVQSSSFCTLFFYFVSKILIICIYYQVQRNPQDYQASNLSDSNLQSYLSIYDIIQAISIFFYLLTFYLAIEKWFGVLKITVGDPDSQKYAQTYMKVIFGISFLAMIVSIICLSLQVLPEFLQKNFSILSSSQQCMRIDIVFNDTHSHWSTFGAVLVTGLSTGFFTWRLRKKIELIYDIDYEFKRKLRFQFWLLIIASIFRSLFNLITVLVSAGQVYLKCFEFSPSDSGAIQNSTKLWACILPLVVFGNNCAVIPFSMLFSPRKKFRMQKEDGPLSSMSEQ